MLALPSSDRRRRQRRDRRRQANGNLDGRLAKEFKCYLPEKGATSEEHPKIIYAQCSVQMKKARIPGCTSRSASRRSPRR